MAMNVFRPLLIFCAGLMAGVAHAQPQWRFHLAFEDATGARDTLWFLWDETATNGSGPGQVDHHLGEGRVEMDLDVFNVWMMNWDWDSTKTQAIPYTTFPGNGGEVHAFNYEYPITIRWDRSLFHASYLPNPSLINRAFLTGLYCYAFGDLPPMYDVCDILDQDSLVVGVGGNWSPLFPTTLYINNLNTIGIDDLDQAEWTAYEADGLLHARVGEGRLREVWVLDASGRVVAHSGPVNGSFNMPFHDAPPGLYIVHALTSNNTYHHGKFVKMVP